MKPTWTRTAVLAVSCLGVLTSLLGCQGAAQIGQGLANAAPAASPPIVRLRDNAVGLGCPTGNFDFSGLYRFEVDVESNTLNKLTVLWGEMGVQELKEFKDAGPGETAFVRTHISGTADDTRTKDKFTIGAPAGGWLKDRLHVLQFQETSPNPGYQGQSKTALTVRRIKAVENLQRDVQCPVTPKPPEPEEWAPSLRGMEPAAGREVLKNLGFQTILDNNTTNTIFGLVILYQNPEAGNLKLTVPIYLVLGFPEQIQQLCPGNPDGGKATFPTCASCPGAPPKLVQQSACQREDATALVKSNSSYKSCEVAGQACP